MPGRSVSGTAGSGVDAGATVVVVVVSSGVVVVVGVVVVTGMVVVVDTALSSTGSDTDSASVAGCEVSGALLRAFVTSATGSRDECETGHHCGKGGAHGGN